MGKFWHWYEICTMYNVSEKLKTISNSFSRSHSVCQLTIERTLNKESARPDSAQRESTSRNGNYTAYARLLQSWKYKWAL